MKSSTTMVWSSTQFLSFSFKFVVSHSSVPFSCNSFSNNFIHLQILCWEYKKKKKETNEKSLENIRKKLNITGPKHKEVERNGKLNL